MADDQSKEKAKPAAKKPAGGVFDVRRPGKTLASPTSRPVIMGHKPEAQAAQTAVSGVGEASPTLPRRKIQIMPSGDIQAVADKPAEAEDKSVEEREARDIPEKDRDALAVAAIDAVTGPPELPEPEKKPVQDQDNESGTGDEKDRSMLFTKSKLVIKPLSKEQEPEAESADEAKSESEESKAPAEPESAEIQEDTKDKEAKGAEEKPEAKDDKEETSEAEAAPEPESESEPSSATPEAGEQPTTPGAESTPGALPGQPGETPEQEEQKPEPHIDPLFNDHGVIVSHHNHPRRGHGLKTAAILLLILVLAAVALDILLDLEILTLPGIPHTDLLQ